MNGYGREHEMSGLEDSVVAAGLSGLAALFRNGSVTPVDVVWIYLDRIDRIDRDLGSYLHIRRQEAFDAAAMSARRWAEGRPLSDLDGAPIAIKANIAIAGAPWHAGIGRYRDRIADTDADCVAALHLAGAIVIGLTNMAEGAFGGATVNPWFGRTHNPHRSEMTAGGSSGGSAAAVAAGLCAGALGTDTLGSVRIPSSYCGCVGYKPAKDLISTRGVVPLSPTLDHVGTHGRSVRDCALLAAGASGVADGEISASGSRRLGLLNFAGRVEVEAGVARALDKAAQKAREGGAVVEEFDLPDYDFNRLRREAFIVCEIEGVREHGLSETDTEGFSPEFSKMMLWAARQAESRIAEAYARVAAAGRDLAARLAEVPALLLPTTPQSAFADGAAPPANQADFTTLANLCGLPAIAIPAGFSADGLPLSVQLMGCEAAAVLAAAAGLEENQAGFGSV
jgi:aspartyl-tRNA(Asn)/glutamyl-tRNA(Gln) amidotransferase subunit A